MYQCSVLAQRMYQNRMVLLFVHAFPSIATGVYGYPVDMAAKVAVRTVVRFLKEHTEAFDLVEWVLFDNQTLEVYENEIDLFYETCMV